MHFIGCRLSTNAQPQLWATCSLVATSEIWRPLEVVRPAPSKLGLAVKGFAWQLTTPQGKEKLRMAFSGSPSDRELWVFCAFARSQVVRFSMRPPRSTISECYAQNSTKGDYALEALAWSSGSQRSSGKRGRQSRSYGGRSPSLNEFSGRFSECRRTRATPRGSRIFHPATTANREAFPALQVGAEARQARCATPSARSPKVAALLF
jgi:hypothetical protein